MEDAIWWYAKTMVIKSAGIIWSTVSRTMQEVAVHHGCPEGPVKRPWTSFSGVKGVSNTCARHYWIETCIGKVIRTVGVTMLKDTWKECHRHYKCIHDNNAQLALRSVQIIWFYNVFQIFPHVKNAYTYKSLLLYQYAYVT